MMTSSMPWPAAVALGTGTVMAMALGACGDGPQQVQEPQHRGAEVYGSGNAATGSSGNLGAPGQDTGATGTGTGVNGAFGSGRDTTGIPAQGSRDDSASPPAVEGNPPAPSRAPTAPTAP